MTVRTRYILAASVGAGIAGMFLVRRRSVDSDISGQVVLITGGSRGLGLALAREFHRNGCRIAICARNKPELEKAQSLLTQEGVEVRAFVCDVSDQGQVNEMVAGVRAHFGRIDILVNNAGEILVAPIENTTVADFERAMAVMFWGVVYSTLAVLPEMRARRRGRIATIASIGGKVSVPHLVAYSCAKSAAVAFCEGLRAELAAEGVRVTTIAPGLMRTGSHVDARFKGQPAAEFAWFSAGATLPIFSMSAERAARQTVTAIRQGSSEKILSLQANLLARVQGAFPGLVPDLLALINRLLPSAGDSAIARDGIDLEREESSFLKIITALGRRAGIGLNQPAS